MSRLETVREWKTIVGRVNKKSNNFFLIFKKASGS